MNEVLIPLPRFAMTFLFLVTLNFLLNSPLVRNVERKLFSVLCSASVYGFLGITSQFISQSVVPNE